MIKGKFHKTKYLAEVPGTIIIYDVDEQKAQHADAYLTLRYTDDHGISFSIAEDRGLMMQIKVTDEVKEFLIEMIGGKYGKVDISY